ncbi:hypothetical protein LCGC14_0262300 [marine sediment metagenome]|uniref:Uncharacterized protein n=1 Tax=marine sediment metagenome TaxID=412755 RepID=A0A0F9WLP0_9ZZZZ
MKIKLIFGSEQLTKEELRLLIQSIRDCEQKSFPDKEIYLWIEVPELSESECQELLASIKPPYKYGPIIIGQNEGEKR